jgi:bisanhydrobacterioruberin hydratase
MVKKMFFPLSFFLLIVFYTVGVWGMVWSEHPDEFVKLTPLNLLITTLLLFGNHEKWTSNLRASLVSIAVMGFAIEAVGVNTGVIFGEYTYGNTLGVQFFNTPLMIGVNWTILSYCSVMITRDLFKIQPKWMIALIAALLMVALDVVIEPVAVETDMWTWSSVSIPLTNYIAWFLIAFVFNFTLVNFFKPEMKNKLALPVYLVQFIFFIVILKMR